MFSLKGVLDARTHHQSVFSRLFREQKEGLRDARGSLLEEHRRSAHLSPLSDTGNSRDVGGITIGEEFRERDSEFVGETSAAKPADNGAARWEEVGEEQDEEVEEQEEQESGMGISSTSSSEEHSGSSNGDNQFSFLTSGFDETTLGGMRPPPFLLPKVVINDGFVQVFFPIHIDWPVSTARKSAPTDIEASHKVLNTVKSTVRGSSSACSRLCVRVRCVFVCVCLSGRSHRKVINM